jgi:hypothetical protein
LTLSINSGNSQNSSRHIALYAVSAVLVKEYLSTVMEISHGLPYIRHKKKLSNPRVPQKRHKGHGNVYLSPVSIAALLPPHYQAKLPMVDFLFKELEC